jgi:hypothetical protein
MMIKGESAGTTAGAKTDRTIGMTDPGTGETRGTGNGVGHNPGTDRIDPETGDTTEETGPGQGEKRDKEDPGTEDMTGGKDQDQRGTTGKTEEEAGRGGKTRHHGLITPVQEETTLDTGQGRKVDKERQETGVTVGTEKNMV